MKAPKYIVIVREGAATQEQIELIRNSKILGKPEVWKHLCRLDSGPPIQIIRVS